MITVALCVEIDAQHECRREGVAMKRCIILLLLGAGAAVALPPAEFQRILSLVGVAFLLLFLCVPFSSHAVIYQKSVSFAAGFLICNFVYWQRWELLDEVISWQAQIPWFVRGTACAVTFFGIWSVWHQEARCRVAGKKEKESWEERNFFPERAADLERLESYIKEDRVGLHITAKHISRR